MRKFVVAMVMLTSSAWSQSSVPGVQVRVDLVREAYVEVEHSFYGLTSRAAIAAPATLAFPSTHRVNAASGTCTGMAYIAPGYDWLGNAQCVVDFNCRLHSATYGRNARGESGAELLATFHGPTQESGTLQLMIDTRGSYGTTTLGEIFVDIGDDGTVDFAYGGQGANIVMREFPLAPGPAGVPIRVLHLGNAEGNNNASSEYRALLQMVFLPHTSPITPYRTGCAPLRMVRWSNAMVMFGFDLQPPGNVVVLAAGAPIHEAPIPMLLGPCGLSCTLDAITIISPGVTRGFPGPWLQGTGQAVVQGFVFTPTGVTATDSWLVN